MHLTSALFGSVFLNRLLDGAFYFIIRHAAATHLALALDPLERPPGKFTLQGFRR